MTSRRTVLLSGLLLLGCSGNAHEWQLTDISGHLPDLEFSLTSDQDRAATAQDYRGDVVLLYFGYTHCPDVCPATMARLAQVIGYLGKKSEDVKVLFVSVDPVRDTPRLMHEYVTAFGAHMVGLTGNKSAIVSMAKRYRVAYQAEKPDANGNYDVTHSSGVYVFDKAGRARLLATSASTVSDITHDIGQLL